MDINKLIEFAFKFEGKKIGIYGTGTGSIKVVNALGVLYKDVVCFFETTPNKQSFLNKSVYSATEQFLKQVDCIIVASEYVVEIKEYLKNIKDLNIFYPFDKELDIDSEIDIQQAKERAISFKRIEKGVSIGRRTYLTRSTIDNHSYLKSIGAFSSINKKVSIGGENHPMKFVSTHPYFYLANDKNIYEHNSYIEKSVDISNENPKIVIGNDVWIATNAVILPGVTIGDGAVIGAGAIVTKDIPPYAVAVGVPARVIKYRFSQDIIKGLLKIKWWNWSDGEIKDNIQYFYDVKKFVDKFLPEVEE